MWPHLQMQSVVFVHTEKHGARYRDPDASYGWYVYTPRPTKKQARASIFTAVLQLLGTSIGRI
jgi:hypothetical protein